MAKELKLTDAELDLMLILWQLKTATVRDLLAHITTMPKPAYTTVSTIVRILEQKRFVKATKQGKTHLYEPLMSKVDYERSTVGHLVKEVFSDKPSDLVRCLLDSSVLSAKELAELRALIST